MSPSETGNTEIVRILLEDQRLNPAARNNDSIREASHCGHTEVVRLLLNDPRGETKVSRGTKYPVDPNDIGDNENIIISASTYDNIELIILLLTDGRVNPSADNNYLIKWASKKNHAEIVRLLLNDSRGETKVSRGTKYPVDPSDENNKAIQLASEKNHIEVMKLLLADPRVDPSNNNNVAIMEASRSYHQEVVKLLLGSDKINLNTKTQALKNLQSCSEFSHDMNYDNIEKLAKMPLKELIQIGNQNLQDRKIIMTKSALAESAKAGYTLV